MTYLTLSGIYVAFVQKQIVRAGVINYIPPQFIMEYNYLYMRIYKANIYTIMHKMKFDGN